MCQSLSKVRLNIDYAGDIFRFGFSFCGIDWFVLFYGISTFLSYLMPNPVYTCECNLFIYRYTIVSACNKQFFLNESELICLYS